jgi:hypothetical protein
LKKESRVLAYGVLGDYIVLATYRRDFLEELFISQLLTHDLEVYIRDKINTYSEITYIVPCTEGKYNARFKSFRVIESGDQLTYREKYCKIITLILCLLEVSKSTPPLSGVLISDLDRCLSRGVNT